MTRAPWPLVLASHLASALVLGIALWLFLTPAGAPDRAPQNMRYAAYAGALLAMAFSAGTVVGMFVTGTSWLPAVYLWLLPLGIVALPAIDPSAAYFVYVGATSKVAGSFALVASALWLVGVPGGAMAVVRLSRPGDGRRASS